MHPTEFDKALRDRYESGSLPPDLAQWEQLARRLDVHAASALPPAPKSRRGLIAFWPAWAAAAAGILIVGWLLLPRSEPGQIATNKTISRPATTPAARQAAAPATPGRLEQAVSAPGEEPVMSPPSRSILASSRAARTSAATPPRAPQSASSQIQTTQAQIASTQQQQPSPANQPQVQQAAPEPQKTYVNFASRNAQIGGDMMDDYDPEEREQRRLSVDLNGGYGPGSLKRNYAFGVSLNRKVTDRIKVEAGVAVVSGTYESFSTGAASSARLNMAAIPENTNNRLTYIQAAPAVTYEIRAGLYAGAGVDAQRLLSDADEARGYEYADAQIETQPTWDFGYTLRAGYKLNRSLKAGLQYRNSMHVSAPIEGSSVQPRNYLLFQLGYTIH